MEESDTDDCSQRGPLRHHDNGLTGHSGGHDERRRLGGTCQASLHIDPLLCLGHGQRSSLPTVRPSWVPGLSLQRSEASFDRHAGRN